MMQTAHTTPAGWRRTMTMVLAVAMAMTALAGWTASAAVAAEEADGGELQWGFRASFRNYVGRQTAALPPIGAVPVGQRITLIGSAQWDLAGTPAWPQSPSNPNETLPYLLEVTGGSVTSASDLALTTTGGAAYHFPSHAFNVYVENVTVVVAGGTATLRGDLTVVIPDNDLGYPPGTYGGKDVLIGTVGTANVTLDDETVTVTGSGVQLSAEGSAALQNFLPAGADLDNFTVTATIPDGDPGEPGDDEQDLVVTVPEPDPEPGEFVWSIDNSGGKVSLGTAAVTGDHLRATGAINPVLVTDTRAGGLPWSISAQVSDFTAGTESFGGRYLGWTPQVVVPGAGAVAGAAVDSGFGGGDGLSVPRPLGSATAGHDLGSTEFGARVELRLPLTVAPGDYAATLTVTALS